MTTTGNTEPEARMTQPKEHCDNEEICRHYCPAFHGHDPCTYRLRTGIICDHDTRSRQHPAPAQGKEQCLCEVCNQKVRQCVERKNMEEAARKSREDVLKELQNWAPGYIEFKGEWVVPVAKLNAFIESLRSEQEQPR